MGPREGNHAPGRKVVPCEFGRGGFDQPFKRYPDILLLGQCTAEPFARAVEVVLESLFVEQFLAAKGIVEAGRVDAHR